MHMIENLFSFNQFQWWVQYIMWIVKFHQCRGEEAAVRAPRSDRTTVKAVHMSTRLPSIGCFRGVWLSHIQWCCFKTTTRNNVFSFTCFLSKFLQIFDKNLRTLIVIVGHGKKLWGSGDSFNKTRPFEMLFGEKIFVF